MRISEEVRALLRLITPEDSAPKLSDLMKLFLEENVKDPSIVSTAQSDWDGHYMNERDYDTYDLKLNGIRIATVLNTFAIVELRWWTRFVSEDVNNGQVPAADPELFEKLWAHIAEVEKKLNCPGFSLIEKPKGPPPGNGKTHLDGYPAFNDGEN